MAMLVPESRDFFVRRLARELEAETGRTRALFTIWLLAILTVILGSATLALAG